MAFDPVTLGAAVQLAKDPATIKASVEDWLDNHPEATTTVEDGSITKAKLHDDLADEIEQNTADVGGLKSATDQLNAEIYGGSVIDQTIAESLGTWREKYTITAQGAENRDNNVMNCQNYLEVDDYAIEGYLNFNDTSDNNGFFVACAFYTSNKTFISRVEYISGTRDIAVLVPNNAVYFRPVVVYKINNVAVEATHANVPLNKLYLKYPSVADGLKPDVAQLKSDMTDVETKANQAYNSIMGGEAQDYKTVEDFTVWHEKMTISQSGVVGSNNDVMYCDEYIDVDDYANDGSIIFRDNTENNGYFVACAFYKSDKTFIERVGYISGERTLSVQIPNDSKYFRIVLVYKVNGNPVAGTLANTHLDKLFIEYDDDEAQGLLLDTRDLQEQMRDIYITPDTMDIQPKFVSNTMTVPGQGLCKVGEHFAISQAGTSSYDSAGSTVNILVYNSAFTNVGYMNHDLGHGSGLCYNQTYDVFLMGNGEANVSPRLDILLNASENVASAVNGEHPSYEFGGSNVMSIYLTKDGQELLDDADGACWCIGGNDRIVIISLRDTNKRRVFYIGMLGVGDQDFSLFDNGYGTFVSGKTNSELNGTIQILKKYECIGENITSAQGIYYDKGKLVVSSSKSNCLIYKIAFYDNGFKIVERYKCSFYNANGTEQSCEPEGLVGVGDGHFYCATTKGVIEFYA